MTLEMKTARISNFNKTNDSSSKLLSHFYTNNLPKNKSIDSNFFAVSFASLKLRIEELCYSL